MTKSTAGRIILHAGMPKAGSSSIQAWLSDATTRSRLVKEGYTVCVARLDTSGTRVDIVPYHSGPVNSGQIIEGYATEPTSRTAIATSLVDTLEKTACSLGGVIISSEAFAQPFWKGDTTILPLLDELAARHIVKVGYYVRPQHTALEAAWRQWGFRSHLLPATYVRKRGRQMRYQQTSDAVSKLAPMVEFNIRPFRSDLLDGGGVVADFVERVLGAQIEVATVTDVWANRGLPLGVVNILREAPSGLFWDSPHDNRKLTRLKSFLESVEVVDSPAVVASRLALQHYCHRVFEPGNQVLIETEGWDTEYFVPPVTRGDERVLPLDALDELWSPEASSGERAVLYAALSAALGTVDSKYDDRSAEEI